MNPDILDKILRAIIVFLQVEKQGLRIPLGNVSLDAAIEYGIHKLLNLARGRGLKHSRNSGYEAVKDGHPRNSVAGIVRPDAGETTEAAVATSGSPLLFFASAVPCQVQVKDERLR
jgi:hypothetical protein